MSTTLWPEPIPIIGGTGEHESGKTVFGLTIAPGSRTLVFDFEGSCASYQNILIGQDGTKFERIDVPTKMQELFPKGYKPVQVFQWWLEQVKAIPPGKYTVIMADPITDIERGLADWVSANPGYFGHTSGQYAKMSGIMWGDVKDYYKSILADIATRCETFYYTAHLGTEFEGNEATKKRKVKGKATLNELASLFLWFERKPGADGIKADKPRAYVRKNRLIAGKWVDGELELHRVLPATLNVATPKAIRDCFANPAGGRASEEGEEAQDESLNEDEKLLIKLRIAEAEAAAALAKGIAVVTTTTAAPVSDAKPADPATTAPTKPTETQDERFKRLMDSINDAKDIEELRKVAATLTADAPKLTNEMVADLQKRFGEVKRGFAKSQTAAQSAPATSAPETPPVTA